ncbi:hypothetical protein CUMW_019900 [Citrus unshiu]|nr:hypothetical protein CUMW_019900 [Citrus unshiu]
MFQILCFLIAGKIGEDGDTCRLVPSRGLIQNLSSSCVCLDTIQLSRFPKGLPVPWAQQVLLQPLSAHLDPLVLCLLLGPNPPLDGPPAPPGPPDRPPPGPAP